MDFNKMINRVIRVFRFDASVFREIAEDPKAMPGGLLIVAAAVILSVIGVGGHQGFGAGDLIMGLIVQLLLFLIFSLLTAVVARVVFKGKTSISEMARTLSYAYAWQMLSIFRAVPVIGPILFGFLWIPQFISGVQAVQEAAEFDTRKALLTMVIVFIPIVLLVGCSFLGLIFLSSLGAVLGNP